MKITVIVNVFNEELMLPFFLKHYTDEVDEIVALLDQKSKDDTKELLKANPKVKIVPIKYLRNYNAEVTSAINVIIQKSDSDWIIPVDVDEFVFPKIEGSFHNYLDSQKADILYAIIYQVFRHADEKDLNYDKLPIPQRIHGDINPFSLSGDIKGYDYVKPCIIRTASRAVVYDGRHGILSPVTYAPIMDEHFFGAHWLRADPVFVHVRGTVRRLNFDRDELENTLRYCEEHKWDPEISAFRRYIEWHTAKEVPVALASEEPTEDLSEDCNHYPCL